LAGVTTAANRYPSISKATLTPSPVIVRLVPHSPACFAEDNCVRGGQPLEPQHLAQVVGQRLKIMGVTPAYPLLILGGLRRQIMVQIALGAPGMHPVVKDGKCLTYLGVALTRLFAY
jgi:hypothetical protein